MANKTLLVAISIIALVAIVTGKDCAGHDDTVIKTCQDTLAAELKVAGKNITLLCQAVDSFLGCMNGISSQCRLSAPVQAILKKTKTLAKNSGCMGDYDPCTAADVHLLVSCQEKMQKAITAAGQDKKKQCGALDDYLLCVNGVSGKCKKSDVFMVADIAAKKLVTQEGCPSPVTPNGSNAINGLHASLLVAVSAIYVFIH